MANLTSIERIKLEKLLDMGGGYVLSFSNRTFTEFILEHTGIDIYDDRYTGYSGSKASRLREFWKHEPNYLVGKLIDAFLAYWKNEKMVLLTEITTAEQVLFDECLKISKRLLSDTLVEQIDALKPNSDDPDFSILAKSIREGIAKNEPAEALDRLHTFVVKYTRNLCDRHSINHEKNMPLHSIFGAYLLYLREKNLVDSEMTMQILKSSIKVLDAFNDVRNNKSLAHDNPILNYDESILIFNVTLYA